MHPLVQSAIQAAQNGDKNGARKYLLQVLTSNPSDTEAMLVLAGISDQPDQKRQILNRVLMLEHSIYSVISPEGAASILWRDTTKAQDAATNMKITAADLTAFGIIDGIISEPVGGAHRDPAAAIAATGEVVASAFAELKGFDRETIRRQRRDKFLAIGRSLE